MKSKGISEVMITLLISLLATGIGGSVLLNFMDATKDGISGKEAKSKITEAKNKVEGVCTSNRQSSEPYIEVPSNGNITFDGDEIYGYGDTGSGVERLESQSLSCNKPVEVETTDSTIENSGSFIIEEKDDQIVLDRSQ